MREDDRGINYEGVCDLESREVGIQRMTDENRVRVKDFKEFLLDVC